MKVFKPLRWGSALGAALIASVSLVPQAKSQLVFEDNAVGGSATEAQVEDRTATRQALGVSEKAQVSQQSLSQQPQTIETAPVPTPVVETEHLSKAELMRRERQREEIKNEDILQERLEELRLRDERRRTEDVLGRSSASSDAHVVASVQEETVVAPVTEHPGRPSLAPAMASSNAAAVSSAGEVDSVAQSSISLAPSDGANKDVSKISVVPRAGFSNMTGDSGFLQISPHFSAGVSAELGTSDNFSFQLGYLYSQYGISMASNSWLVQGVQSMASWTGQNFQSINMKQNIFDAGAKLHLLGADSKVRPFFGAGGGYEVSYINFASGILNSIPRGLSPDYTLKRFLGYLSAGGDFRVARSITVGAEFRYYAVLSVSESGNFSNYLPYFYGGAIGQDTAIAGASLARNNFYSILGNVTFSF